MFRKITEKGLARHVSDKRVILVMGRIEYHGKLSKENEGFVINSSHRNNLDEPSPMVPYKETFNLIGGEHLELLTNTFYQSGNKKVFCSYEFHRKVC